MALVESEVFKAGTLKIILNDPDNLNAMSEKMADQFLSLVNSIIAAKSKPRAIILTGSGRAFSAGGDLQMLEAKTKIKPEENKKIMLKFYNSFLSILHVNVPLIAAINGHAIGAGLCLASACDIRVCSPTAKLGFTFARLGLHPGMGATYFLPKLIGDSSARRMLFTGKIIDAAEALRTGLVSEVSDNKTLDQICGEIISEITECGPKSVSLLAANLRSAENDSLLKALEREAEYQAQSYADDEFKEGVRAAIEKRKPAFFLS